MTGPDQRLSKLPRLAPVPVVGTPQSAPRYRPSVSPNFANSKLFTSDVTQETGGRIPRVADGVTPTRAQSKRSSNINKPLPAAPNGSTPGPCVKTEPSSKQLSSSAPPKTKFEHQYAATPTFTRTPYSPSSMAMSTRKPSPMDSQLSLASLAIPHPSQVDTDDSSHRLSANPLQYSAKFTVRKLRTPSPAGEGPILRISHDADNIIFGESVAQVRTESPPSTAGSPDLDQVTVNRQNTLDALEGRRSFSAETQDDSLEHLKRFVDKASKSKDALEILIPESTGTPDIPETSRPEFSEDDRTALRVTNRGVGETSSPMSMTSLAANTAGLAITTTSCHRIDEHEWVSSGISHRGPSRIGGADPFPAVEPHGPSLNLSDVNYSQISDSCSISELTPPHTPLLSRSPLTSKLVSPVDSIKGDTSVSRPISRLPVARPSMLITPPRTDEVKPRRKPTVTDTIARKYSNAKDRIFGFRLPTKSSNAQKKSTPEAVTISGPRFSMISPGNTVSPPDRRQLRQPVRSIFNDLVHRRKTKKEGRASTPLVPPRPATVRTARPNATPVPPRVSVHKSRTAPALLTSTSSPYPPSCSIEPVDRHNSTMKKAQTLRARVRDVTNRMAPSRGKLELLQATEIFNSTTTHAIAALSACERARVAALDARRFWELSFGAMQTNMGILETKVARAGVSMKRKRRGSF